MASWSWLEPPDSGESESKEWTKEAFHWSPRENLDQGQSEAGHSGVRAWSPASLWHQENAGQGCHIIYGQVF